MRRGRERRFSSLTQFGLTAENTLLTRLKAYPSLSPSLALSSPSLRSPQEIKGCHYVSLTPEKVSQPYLITFSSDCAKLIGIDLKDISSELFVSGFAGNTLFPGLDSPYATVYGCHSFGTWFGQLGWLFS